MSEPVAKIASVERSPGPLGQSILMKVITDEGELRALITPAQAHRLARSLMTLARSAGARSKRLPAPIINPD